MLSLQWVQSQCCWFWKQPWISRSKFRMLLGIMNVVHCNGLSWLCLIEWTKSMQIVNFRKKKSIHKVFAIELLTIYTYIIIEDDVKSLRGELLHHHSTPNLESNDNFCIDFVARIVDFLFEATKRINNFHVMILITLKCVC